MKKLLIASNIIFLSIIFYQACSPVKTVVSTVSCPPCKNYSGIPFTGLTSATAWNISQDYKNQNRLQISMGQGTTVSDANSIWFSLETLKNFIWNIEDAACKNGCYNLNSGVRNLNLGIRVYYARYPSDVAMQNNNDLSILPNSINGPAQYSFANHHTVFMVPTFRDANNVDINWDFDPWHWSTSATNTNCTPTSMAQWLVDTIAPFGNNRSLILSQTSSYSTSNTTTQNSAANHGDMIPPGKQTPPQGPGY